MSMRPGPAAIALIFQFLPFAGLAAAECGAIAELAPEGMTITESTAMPASDDAPVAHCLVRGRMAERVGSDGNSYAISFELRLPDDWTGQFAHQFNGGNDGAVVPAFGRLNVQPEGDSALARGFAVVSSDAGHDGSAHPEAGLAGGNIFGFDFEARRDYGYGAVAKLHPAAIALTEAWYEAPVQYTYGLGSSNGGRHALIAASRMAESFDGLIAGYPGFRLPRAAIQHAWDVQTFRSVGDSLAEAFSREEVDTVAAHILRACDGLDGLDDALIFDIDACQTAFDPASLVCGSAASDDCLPESKVAALVRIFGGPRNSAGEQLYSEWDWDAGIASNGWRSWKLESPVPAWDHRPIIAVMGAGSLAQVFTTPPTPLAGDPASLEAFLMAFDFDTDAPKVDATSADFPESAMQLISPPDADSPSLEAFEAAGSKLIVFHGVSDPVFSFRDSVNWYARLLRNNPDAAAFTRLYAVPGMPHGPGGIAPDRFDVLGKLVDWVEHGSVPESIVATVRDDNEAAPESLRGATRKLCPWPAVAQYTGDDPSLADSFSCSDTQ